jgi:copper chaperone CopZ
MMETTIRIEGMSCQHCVTGVKRAIDTVAGVTRSDVAVGSATIQFDESKAKKEDIIAAVEKAGYKVGS